jgi:hypothetical protein
MKQQREYLLSKTYRCRLHAPVWSKAADQEPSRYRPSLIFVMETRMKNTLLAQVSAWADDDLPSRDRWVVEYYPLDDRHLPAQTDEGHRLGFYHKARRVEPLLSRGEIREPRDTAAAAIKLALDKLADLVNKAELAEMRNVAEVLRPSLEMITACYLKRLRPRTTYR